MPNWTDRPHAPTTYRQPISAALYIGITLLLAVVIGWHVAGLLNMPAPHVVRHSAPRWVTIVDYRQCISTAGAVTRQWPDEVCE